MDTNNELFFLFLLFVVYFPKVDCFSFDMDNSVKLTLNRKSYFGYSLLLQTGGEVSTLIVGAPKNLQQPLEGGEVYRCPITSFGNSIQECARYASETHLHNWRGSKVRDSTGNGDFYGGSIDGGNLINEEFVACAPRYENTKYTVYIEGVCLLMNSSSAQGKAQKLKRISKPDKAHGNGKEYIRAGAAMNGFDVSFIFKTNILTGAPGMDQFQGAVAEHTLPIRYSPELLPDRFSRDADNENTYFGYAVTHGRFQNQLCYISGTPKGNDLKGEVTIFRPNIHDFNYIKFSKKLEGKELGSYFGASILALDVNNDGKTDLIIGAPMSAGKTYDEGKVYYYKGGDQMHFDSSITLTGSSTKAARFGTKIVSLGDFDQDGYNDVAISAPYENGGAVYIYKGGRHGLTDDFSQKLTQEGYWGFGLGLSRGGDIDGNGHNDIVVGAYKSDTVFIIKSESIIDQEVLLTSPVKFITNTTKTINFKLCIKYLSRTPQSHVKMLDFSIHFDMDYRINSRNMAKSLVVDVGKYSCEEYEADLEDYDDIIKDISPLLIKVTVDVTSPHIKAEGSQKDKVQIPFSHNCGDDNFCTPDLLLEMSSQTDQVTLNKNNNLVVDVEVKNINETAYHCEVVFTVPDKIELVRRGCVKVKKRYRCLVANSLAQKETVKTQFSFYIGDDFDPDIKTIKINAEVVSLGKQVSNSTNKDSIEIPVLLDSTPYIHWESFPETTQIDLVENVTDQHFNLKITMGKLGVSPLKIELTILVPLLEQGGKIFDVEQIEGRVESHQLTATYSEGMDIEKSDVDLTSLKIPLNRTVVVDIFETGRVMKYSFSGPYLRHEELAYFKIKVLMRVKLLAAKYRTELTMKDMVAFVPTAVMSNKRTVSSLFLMFVNKPGRVPLWVFILAPTVGVFVLILIASALYKCDFFNREYKDQLVREKKLSLEEFDNEGYDEILDDVVFVTDVAGNEKETVHDNISFETDIISRAFAE